MQMRHCAFAYISVVPCDCYPLKTVATCQKRQENSPEAGDEPQLSRSTLQKLPMESLVMQRLGSRVERPFCVSIEAAGLAAFVHRTRFRDPGSLVQT
jgi:hypothetical protein